MNPLIPMLVNILVIGVIVAELIATALGEINADRLLIVSILSGGLTIFSMQISQRALDRLKQGSEWKGDESRTERKTTDPRQIQHPGRPSEPGT